MKKNILTEICIFLFTVCISVGLYYLIYGINLRCDNYLDMLTFEIRRQVIIAEIIGIFFLPIHITITVFRQFYYSFLKLYLALEILIEAIFLISLLFYKYLFLSSESLVMANEGWTIYPPLTGLAVLDEHDTIKLRHEQTLLLILMVAILLLSFVLTFLTFRRRKKRQA